MIEYLFVLLVIVIICFIDFSILNLDDESESILYTKMEIEGNVDEKSSVGSVEGDTLSDSQKPLDNDGVVDNLTEVTIEQESEKTKNVGVQLEKPSTSTSSPITTTEIPFEDFDSDLDNLEKTNFANTNSAYDDFKSHALNSDDVFDINQEFDAGLIDNMISQIHDAGN